VAPEVRVEQFDPLVVSEGSAVVRRLVSLYPLIIRRAPPVWGALYHSTNNRPAFELLQTALGGRVSRLVGERIDELDPNLVISVHPLLNHLTAAAIKRSSRRRTLVTVATDLIDLHCGWACPSAQLVVVATENAQRTILGRLRDERKISLLGIPVDLRFRPPAPGEQQALRRRFGLDENRPTLLVASGGDGSGKLIHHVRALASRPHPWQVIVVCGRNQRARQRLLAMDLPTPTLVLGFVDTIPELMRASDLLIGKAGPGTIVEALATELPMIITSHLPGQETPNIRFVTESGIGEYVPRPERLLSAVERLLGDDRHQLQTMAGNALTVARPYASIDIARRCLDLVEGRTSK
jgi:1,2-diacylglycerol 3-beta-galactosyltransferase